MQCNHSNLKYTVSTAWGPCHWLPRSRETTVHAGRGPWCSVKCKNPSRWIPVFGATEGLLISEKPVEANILVTGDYLPSGTTFRYEIPTLVLICQLPLPRQHSKVVKVSYYRGHSPPFPASVIWLALSKSRTLVVQSGRSFFFEACTCT